MHIACALLVHLSVQAGNYVRNLGVPILVHYRSAQTVHSKLFLLCESIIVAYKCTMHIKVTGLGVLKNARMPGTNRVRFAPILVLHCIYSSR